MADTIEMPKLPMTPTRMTPLERAMGRFMRAPDHDAGTDNGDANADDGAGDTQANAEGGEAGDGAGAEGGDDNGSLMGGAGAAEAEGGAGEDGEGSAQDEGEADGPPEAYDLTMPEGVTLDDDLLAEATPLLKEAGLKNDAANKLVPLVGKIGEKAVAAAAQHQADEFGKMKAEWAKAAKSDKEIGGTNWDKTDHLVAKALDQFGAPQGSEFRALLDDSGLGNHPEMIRMFRRIGEALGEDDQFVRAGSATSKQPREAVLYPDDVPGNQKEGTN